MEKLLENDNANGNCEVAFKELWTGNTNTSTSPCLLNSANEELLDNSKPVTFEKSVHPQDDINKNCTELNNFQLVGSTSRNQGFVSLDQGKPVAAKRANKEHSQLNATSCGDVNKLTANSNILGSSQHPAPPLLSDHDATGLMTSQINKKSGGNFDEIEMLWLKVESLMTAKQGKVQQVLGGYSEAGGGGGDNKDRETEEERVWQVLQRNLSVE